MPSIRRSLTLYLLLLVGGGLAVVAAVTDGVVGRTLDARRASEADRVRDNFEVQCQADRERLDVDLWAEAQTVLDKLRDRFADRRNAEFWRSMPAVDAVAGPAGAQLAVRLHFAQMRMGDDALPPADPSHPDAHPPLCQVSITDRPEPLVRSTSLGADGFPHVAANPDRAFDFDYTYDSPAVDGRPVRLLVVKVPFLSPRFPRRPPGRGGRPPAGERPPPPADRPPRPDRPPPGLPARMVIQYARPLAALDDEFARHRREMADTLAALDADIARERAGLRLSLATVAGATFLGILVGGPLLVRRGLRPVTKLSDAVGRVSERDFRLPVAAAEVGRELLPIHDRLSHTLAALRRAFEREKDAIADISHELRTPVAGLQATLDVALRKPRTADQYRTTLEECRGITKQLGRLVERVLTLARLDADAVSKAVPTDLADLTAGCVAVVRPLAEAHGLTVTADLHPGLSAVTDPDQVREVVMNLLSNAVEYNSPGGSVGVTARPSGGAAVIEVRDTGIGMSPEVSDRIFERFYRADPARHATGAHAGLGLAIVKEAVAKLGGTVAVESAPGRGSTFRVTLPA